VALILTLILPNRVKREELSGTDQGDAVLVHKMSGGKVVYPSKDAE